MGAVSGNNKEYQNSECQGGRAEHTPQLAYCGYPQYNLPRDRLAAFGLSDPRNSRHPGISESSVKVIVRSAKTKTNVVKRTQGYENEERCSYCIYYPDMRDEISICQCEKRRVKKYRHK